MSAPATNALSPTPVITINLTSGFDTDDLTAWSISENVSIFKAFNTEESLEHGMNVFKFTELEIVRSEILKYIVKVLQKIKG